MNVAFFLHEGRETSLMRRCFRSLLEHSQCRTILYGCERMMKSSFVEGVEFRPIDTKRWAGRRMTHRMELCLELSLQPDDCVLVLDTDLLFQSDPFSVFGHPFDLFYTSRHYSSRFVVNAGVWGFRWTSDAQNLLKFIVDQATNPQWRPYLDFRLKAGRMDRRVELDWWTNQDLLCVLSEHSPPLSAKVHDAGSKYNFCPRSGGGVQLTPLAVEEFLDAFGDPSIVTLHYKELKHRLVKLL